MALSIVTRCIVRNVALIAYNRCGERLNTVARFCGTCGAEITDPNIQSSIQAHWPDDPANLPSDLIYAIVEAAFANHEELMGIHSAAAETLPANFTRNTFLPFHHGASDWYGRKAASGVVRG